MADGIEFKVEGLDALVKKMEGLTYDIKYKGGRFALRKAAQVIRDEARRNAERIDDLSSPENISLNIVERWSGRRFRRTGDLMFRVGVLGGARKYANTRENVRKGRAGQFYSTGGDSGNPGGDTWYWRFLEFGTERSKARPFLRPAVDKSAGAALEEFVRQYDKALDRAIRRLERSGGSR